MKKRYLLFGLLALVIVVALVAVACGGGDDTATTEQVTTTADYPVGSSTGPIKVGHIYDETGNEAIVGSVFKQAIECAFVDATVGGRTVELIEADSKSTTEGAVEAARKLVEQDKVDIIMGPTQIGQKNAVATYAAEKQIPLVLYNPTPPGDLESNEWVLGVGGLTAGYGTTIADYMYNDLGYRTISTLGPEDSSGHAFFQPMVDYFTASGGQVVQQQWAVGQTDDWSAYLTTVEEADALVAWVGGSGIPLLTAYYDTGVINKIPLVGAFHGGFLDPWVPRNVGEGNKAAGAALVGIKTVMAWNPESTSAVNEAYKAALPNFGPWKAEDGGPSGPYQAGLVVLKALESCATNLSGIALRDAILAVDTEGPEGRVFFAPGDNVATKPFYIVEVAIDPVATAADTAGRNIFKYTLVKAYDAVPPHGLTK